jgi:hypothetical protein
VLRLVPAHNGLGFLSRPPLVLGFLRLVGGQASIVYVKVESVAVFRGRTGSQVQLLNLLDTTRPSLLGLSRGASFCLE